MTGLAAVQSRIAELQALVAPAPASSAVDPSGFASALADASSLLGTTDAPTSTSPAPRVDATGTRPTSDGVAPGTGLTGQDLVRAAERYLGTPYVWGGESLAEGGLDCSGLVLRALTDLGVEGVPRVARDQQELGEGVASLDQALPGDLLVFDGGSHIAIYVGDGQMIDAPKPGGQVSVRDVYEEPTSIRRVLPQEQTLSADLATLTSGSTLASPLLGGDRLTAAPFTGAPFAGAAPVDVSTAAARTQWQVLASLMGGAA